MTSLRFVAMPSDMAEAYRAGEPDANGQTPERHISDGSGTPCRHCLTDVEEGEPYLILSYRPFEGTQPYAEQGPIFLHAETCPRYADETRAPEMFTRRERFLMRGYNSDDRIIYGSGSIVDTKDLDREASKLLDDANVNYVHLRSGSYNCFQCKIERP
jgi:hypothetical protein